MIYDPVNICVMSLVTNKANLQPLLHEDWDAIPQHDGTMPVTSMRFDVTAFGSSTCYQGPDMLKWTLCFVLSFLLWEGENIRSTTQLNTNRRI